MHKQKTWTSKIETNSKHDTILPSQQSSAGYSKEAIFKASSLVHSKEASVTAKKRWSQQRSLGYSKGALVTAKRPWLQQIGVFAAMAQAKPSDAQHKDVTRRHLKRRARHACTDHHVGWVGELGMAVFAETPPKAAGTVDRAIGRIVRAQGPAGVRAPASIAHPLRPHGRQVPVHACAPKKTAVVWHVSHLKAAFQRCWARQPLRPHGRQAPGACAQKDVRIDLRRWGRARRQCATNAMSAKSS
jgi:hypothetical protein